MTECKVVYIVGSKTQTGKSMTCLGLISYILENKIYKAEEIAYIKPATQCRSPNNVWKYCAEQNIEFQGIGPIVFYKGFTAECVEGKHKAEDLLQSAVNEIEKLKKGRKLVIVDGVGYPSVGSVCGVSNAHIASAIKAPVILVGSIPDGSLGNTIDTFNMNYAYLQKFDVPVIGVLFNKIPKESLEYLKKYVSLYFQKNEPNIHIYGFVPTEGDLQEWTSKEPGMCQIVNKQSLKMSEIDKSAVNVSISLMHQNVNFQQILEDLMNFRK